MSIAFSRVSVALVAALGLVVFASSPALAQGVGGAQGGTDETHEGIGIGIKGGWLVNSFSGEGLVDFNSRTGQQIGIFLGGNRPGLLGVMAEINYGQKGGNIENTDFHVDFNFVSVPVVLRVNGGSKSLSGVSFYGIAGTQFDWIIDASASLPQGEVDISDDTEGFEYSFLIGGGVEITRFIIELRYIKGLKSIAKDFALANTEDLKTKAFAILFGFRFN